MKVVLHSSRGYSNTKPYGTLHNDRNFSCEAANIIKSKTANNIVWLYQDNLLQGKEDQQKVNTIEDCEREFYKDKFSPWLKIKNEQYRKIGHKERMMTMDKFRSYFRYCPEEIIFQVGTIDDCPPLKEFIFISYAFLDYLQNWSKNHDNAFTILDWALHQDEIGAPHLHIRRVWHYIDEKDNILKIGQEKTLERIGYLPPLPQKEPSRYNTRKIAYDEETRKWIIAFCKSRNLKIDEVPKEKSMVGLELSDYIIKQKIGLKEREEKVSKDKYKLGKKIISYKRERKNFQRFVNSFLSISYKGYLKKLSENKLENEYETKFNEVVGYVLTIYEQDIENNVEDYKNFCSSFSIMDKRSLDKLKKLYEVEKYGKIERKDALYFFNHNKYLNPLVKERIKQKMNYFVSNTNDYLAYKSIIELNLIKKELFEKKKVEKKEYYQSM